ncbi:MAG: site-specific integrase [Propionibacteriales bacterium]|nr:site-specific integrase [Propionibacteriales bacterium]
MLSILRQTIRRAQARNLVSRNVAELCDPPLGQKGRRPSNSLTLDQAMASLAASTKHPSMHGYVTMSLLTGARAEELRALTWADVDLVGRPEADPPIPPSMSVVRSVRVDGDTKTTQSRRGMELPSRCVDALPTHRARSGGGATGLVFHTATGAALDAANVRRAFRSVVRDAGLDPAAWTPRELRHSFVSLLSSEGLPIEDISRLVGHATTRTTERVYRKELRPVLRRGATTMDRLFPEA